MRSVGDHNWLNNYVGIAYLPGGRTKDGLDCYGLCKLIYHDVYDIVLPDWQEDVHEIKARAKTIEEVTNSGTWQDIDDPDEGCFVICTGHHVGYHVGLYFAGGVIHSHETSGVVFEPLHRFVQRFHRVSFGYWTP